MAKCDYCKHEMTTAAGCTVAIYDDFPDGIGRARIPCGAPGDFHEGDERCHDCNAKAGRLAHARWATLCIAADDQLHRSTRARRGRTLAERCSQHLSCARDQGRRW
jgi:hypothetical protein